jgi:hypothetical protein
VMVDVCGKDWPLDFQMYKSKIGDVKIMFLLKNAAVQICNIHLNSLSGGISSVPCHTSRPPLSPIFDWRGIRLLKLVLKLCPSTYFALCGKSILITFNLSFAQHSTQFNTDIHLRHTTYWLLRTHWIGSAPSRRIRASRKGEGTQLDDCVVTGWVP